MAYKFGWRNQPKPARAAGSDPWLKTFPPGTSRVVFLTEFADWEEFHVGIHYLAGTGYYPCATVTDPADICVGCTETDNVATEKWVIPCIFADAEKKFTEIRMMTPDAHQDIENVLPLIDSTVRNRVFIVDRDDKGNKVAYSVKVDPNPLSDAQWNELTGNAKQLDIGAALVKQYMRAAEALGVELPGAEAADVVDVPEPVTDAQKATETHGPDLLEMSTEQLADYLRERGVNVPAKARRSELVKLAAMAPAAEDAPPF